MRLRSLWRVVGVGTFVVAAYALWRVVEATRSVSDDADAAARPAATLAAGPDWPGTEPRGAAWVDADGPACPATHPVKANLRSGIYHVPGGASYARTLADRCYRDAAAAVADGLRASRR